MKVWSVNGFIEMNIGQRVFVGRRGSGHTVFGEEAVLTGYTRQHLVFTTVSGSTVKTKIDNLCDVVGKAKKERYFVSTRLREAGEYITERVSYWNEKKLCLEYK